MMGEHLGSPLPFPYFEFVLLFDIFINFTPALPLHLYFSRSAFIMHHCLLITIIAFTKEKFY